VSNQIPDFLKNQTDNPDLDVDPIRVLAEEHPLWVRYNFPDSLNKPEHAAMGIVEEWAELDQAVKRQDWPEMEDAVGDILIYKADLCGKLGLDLLEISAEADQKLALSIVQYELDYIARSHEAIHALGRVSHHMLKMAQGIRGSREDHVRAVHDCLVTLFYTLLRLCESADLHLENCVAAAWRQVRLRDWQNKSKDGKTS
jgi:hypothetical protein